MEENMKKVNVSDDTVKSNVTELKKTLFENDNVKQILLSDELNTYVMLCTPSKDSLYKRMMDDITILCEFIKNNIVV